MRTVRRIDGVERLFLVGDVQGNAGPLLELLEEAGLVREQAWSGGRAALVLLGDLFDGGDEPAEVLWLLESLAPQARAAGGEVVLVQGNHELVMAEALAAGEGEPLGRWFSNDGALTVLRLAASLGRVVPERLLAESHLAAFGGLEDDAEMLEVVRAVRDGLRPELRFLANELVPAVLVNGAVLAVHGAPNLEASSLATFVCSDWDEKRLAWDRTWLTGWDEASGAARLALRLRALARRLEAPGIALRHLVFGHTALGRFAVPALRGQFRIGQVAGDDEGVPAVWDAMTCPRAVPPGGALGGLLFDGAGVTAVYGRALEGDPRRWPIRERLAGPDPAFR